MNCFFVSCEIAKNPQLEGKKVAVGHIGNDRKGIILAASYEARPYGIRAAMPVQEALYKCPDLILVEPNMELYNEYSRKFFDYFLTITPLVEPGSIDEAYLDVTDVCSPSMYVELAKTIQNDIYNNFHLKCSVGIAPNKFLAKMASDMKKPMGITILRKREIDKLMWPLPISEMYGVGKRSIDSFNALGIKTIGDLANYKDMKLLNDVLGKNNAEHLFAHAHGEGSNEVDVNRFNDVSSISNSQTLDQDEYDITKMMLVIKILTNAVANRLEKSNLKAYTFTLQIKYFNHRQVSKSKTIDQPLNDNYKIYDIMKELFEDLYETDIPVRLFGVGASKLCESKEEIRQLSLFDKLDDEQKDFNISQLIDTINKSIGVEVIRKGIIEKQDSKDLFSKTWRKDINEQIKKIK